MSHKEFYNGKKIVVTGGAGFIGSELSAQLASCGAKVEIVDNLINGKEVNVGGILNENVALHKVDIRDTDKMRSIIQDADIFFHLACLGVRHSIHSPYENHEVNAEATLKLLMLSRELNVGRFVYVSTSEVYGTGKFVPMTEDHPTFPMTVYGASKLAGECYARAYFRTFDYPTVVVRPFNSYGPRSHHEGDSGEVIPKFMLRSLAGKPMVVFGDGSQTRDFTYVADTARGMLLAGMSDKAVGETFNLGQGKEITILELADTIKQILNLPDAAVEHIEDRPGDVLRLFADSSFAREMIGFEPQVSLKEGITKLKEWYDASGKSIDELIDGEQVRGWQKG